jgi:hypothetical protein
VSASAYEQPTLDGMPDQLFACTPHKLASFDCPRRYRMSYLDRPRPEPGGPLAHNTLGATIHLALAKWWELARASRTPERGADLVRRLWQSHGFRDDAQSQQWREIAAEWVEQYLSENVDADTEPAGVERTVSAAVGRLLVSGRVDRIDERGAELVIVDYKSGRRRLTEADAAQSLALALYALATARTLRRRTVRVELHHLPTGRVAAFEHTDASLADRLSHAESIATAIEGATRSLEEGADPDVAFPPRPSSGCTWCEFRRHCEVGRAHTPSLDPWAGLANLG